MPFCDRIEDVTMLVTSTPEVLSELGSLTSLRYLHLNRTQVTNAGLEHLERLTSLKWLDLSHTQVTDAGLSQLTKLYSLEWLELHDTQVTAEGRALLRKTLPSCRIQPEP
jgi:Leucine-rich repeat (LRR) protein